MAVSPRAVAGRANYGMLNSPDRVSLSSGRLITIGVSHYCEKARWALERFNLPFTEERHAPLTHMLPVYRAIGKRNTTPIFKGSNVVCPTATHFFCDSSIL